MSVNPIPARLPLDPSSSPKIKRTLKNDALTDLEPADKLAEAKIRELSSTVLRTMTEKTKPKAALNPLTVKVMLPMR